MTDHDWRAGFGQAIVMFLNGQGIPSRDNRGQRITGDSFLVFFNAHHATIEFNVPSQEYGPAWVAVLDTHTEIDERPRLAAGSSIPVLARQIVVLRCVA